MSEATRLSVLARAATGDSAAWERLVGIYEPLIQRWLRSLDVPKQEADDLAQEVMVIVVKELPRFSHEGRTGSFRLWLRRIAVNQARRYWRNGRCRAATPGGLSFLEVLNQLEVANSDLSREWDAEHDQQVYRRLIEVLEDSFEPATVQIFRLMVQQGRTGPEVAAAMGRSLAAVYGARARVLRRLRQEAEGLLD